VRLKTDFGGQGGKRHEGGKRRILTWTIFSFFRWPKNQEGGRPSLPGNGCWAGGASARGAEGKNSGGNYLILEEPALADPAMSRKRVRKGAIGTCPGCGIGGLPGELRMKRGKTTFLLRLPLKRVDPLNGNPHESGQQRVGTPWEEGGCGEKGGGSGCYPKSTSSFCPKGGGGGGGGNQLGRRRVCFTYVSLVDGREKERGGRVGGARLKVLNIS